VKVKYGKFASHGRMAILINLLLILWSEIMLEGGFRKRTMGNLTHEA